MELVEEEGRGLDKVVKADLRTLNFIQLSLHIFKHSQINYISICYTFTLAHYTPIHHN
uniref:Uncharacterized protein n=1 Tax=Octopus bimaculoides TaxID=37653 RepID=A0A0L8FR35_OCTBM